MDEGGKRGAARGALTRRRFVLGAGMMALAAGTSLAFGCAAPRANEPEGAAGVGEVPEGVPAAGERSRPEEALGQRVEELLASMTEHERLCQLFVVTPEALTGVGQVVQAGSATEEALAAHPVGGVAYFGQNLLDAVQTREMLAATARFAEQAGAGVAPLLCVDEEGGTVTRIGGQPGFPVEDVGDMAAVGARGDAAEARDVAERIGGYLRELGFNTDFAPVCDVASNPEGTMGRRAFGSDPTLVATMVAAQVEGFREARVLCSAKHFPGIGAAVGDSHDDRIVYEGGLSDLEATELVPFRAAVEAGVPMVMVGHLSVPAVTGDDAPACLAPAVVEGLLRHDLGFEGMVVTDSLSMGAVGRYYDAAASAVLALQAGCDLLLMPPDLDEALEGVRAALADGRLSWERVEASLRRILAMKLCCLGEG